MSFLPAVQLFSFFFFVPVLLLQQSHSGADFQAEPYRKFPTLPELRDFIRHRGVALHVHGRILSQSRVDPIYVKRKFNPPLNTRYVFHFAQFLREVLDSHVKSKVTLHVARYLRRFYGVSLVSSRV